MSYLNKGLDVRKQKIEDVYQYLTHTEQLFTAFGSTELKHITQKFEDIRKSLSSESEVKLVVIGEFSRGKSTLVNALLDILLLRSAQEATTAINTFVRKLPEGVDQRFIRIYFQDGRFEDLEWLDGDNETLEKWSTELDTSHASARQQIDKIEIFTSHPLLNQGLVLIDTPGLQSVVEHHEGITRRAIDEAHIAIWVQSTQQLGGNATEWKFLSGTIRKNFNKFLTVVNMWDSVLDPQDPFDQELPLQKREQKKYDVVRKNFEKNLPEISKESLAQMTNSQHLIGVSAAWAISKDLERKKRSNIDQLASRISDMFSSGEALDQVYKKPLKTLHAVQVDLLASVSDELKQLDSDQSTAERQRDIEQLDLQIKTLQQELTHTNKEAKYEHDRCVDDLTDSLKNELIVPLTDLQADIELQLTHHFVETQIAKRVKHIGLPDALQQKYDDVCNDIDVQMQKHQDKIQAVLKDLRQDYAKELEQHAQHLQSKVKDMNFTLPELNLNFDIDFHALNEHLEEEVRINEEAEKKRQALNAIEDEIANNEASPENLERARLAHERVERQKNSLGERPEPRVIHSTREIPRDWIGWMGFTRTEHYVDYDDSNVDDWKNERDELKEKLKNREAFLEKLQKEEEQKGQQRSSAERKQRMYEQELRKIERKEKELAQQKKETQAKMVEDVHKQLFVNTSGHLKNVVRQLEQQVKPNIEHIFNAQLNLLQAQVKEQISEPLNAKLEQRQQVQNLLEQGKEQINLRKEQLIQAEQEINALILATSDALADVNDLK